jgi:hypothetical protein
VSPLAIECPGCILVVLVQVVALGACLPLSNEITSVSSLRCDRSVWLVYSELNELDQIVGAPELERKKSPQWGMTSKAKSPSAPPTAPRPREIPHFGDPNGLSKVDLVDPANMSPIPVLMIACNRSSIHPSPSPLLKSCSLVVRGISCHPSSC